MKMISCKEASRLISEGQERQLGRMECWSLRFHLWMCHNCRRFEQQMQFLRKTLHAVGDSQGPTLSLMAKDRIRRALLDLDPSST
jgi:hypothetical protein